MNNMLLLIFIQLLIIYTPSKTQPISDTKMDENDILFDNRELHEDDDDDLGPLEDDSKDYDIINERYQNLSISEKELENKYKSLMEENKNNAIKIELNKIYLKSLAITSIILASFVVLIFLTKLYKVCFSSNLNSVFIENLKQKLTNSNNKNSQLSNSSENFNSKIIQNNINVSCFNLLNSSNLSLNNLEKSDSFNTYEKNYAAPIIATCFPFNENEQKCNTKGNYNNNELEYLINKPK